MSEPVESSSLREIEKKVLLEENNVRARVKKYWLDLKGKSIEREKKAHNFFTEFR